MYILNSSLSSLEERGKLGGMGVALGGALQTTGKVCRVLDQEKQLLVSWVITGSERHLVGIGFSGAASEQEVWGKRQAHPVILSLRPVPFLWDSLALCCLFWASAEIFSIKKKPKGGMIRYLILMQSERTPDVSFCLKVRGRKSN